MESGQAAPSLDLIVIGSDVVIWMWMESMALSLIYPMNFAGALLFYW
jgi:predicted DNA-binding protein (UPF0278 family)